MLALSIGSLEQRPFSPRIFGEVGPNSRGGTPNWPHLKRPNSVRFFPFKEITVPIHLVRALSNPKTNGSLPNEREYLQNPDLHPKFSRIQRDPPIIPLKITLRAAGQNSLFVYDSPNMYRASSFPVCPFNRQKRQEVAIPTVGSPN